MWTAVESHGDLATSLAPVEAEEVVRQILRLQAEAGGSIVDGRMKSFDASGDALGVIPATAAIPLPSSTEINEPPSSRNSNVATLQSSAKELDDLAHLLETSKLFVQAESLRKLSGRLRHDARLLIAMPGDDRKRAAEAELIGPALLPPRP